LENILITAGPTREYLDEVRFLSNPSSGRMGYVLASSFAGAGYRVTLVSGPTHLADPAGVRTIRVESALDMQKEVLRQAKGASAVVMTAAVTDWRPKRRFKGKRRRGVKPISIELVPNPDILAQLGRRKERPFLVGFALEVGQALASARKKLLAKNLDYIVVNSPSSFASDRISCKVLGRRGIVASFREVRKEILAQKIVRLVSEGLSSKWKR